MMRRPPVLLATLAGVALASLAVGCVSLRRTPGARFFVLRSVLAPASSERIGAEGALGVLPVRLPGALDRPQLVTWAGASELRLDEYARWAEPLDEGATRTLAENLAALRPRDRFLRTPWPAGAPLRCRIGTELRVFGLQADGTVRIGGDFVLLAAKEERVLVRRAFTASRGPLAKGPAGLEAAASVEAMSELLGDLANEIAAALEALPPS